ncbi:MAG: radical SAM protein, partial [Eubacteriales bacterium]|nr:radical SAM protein [Eubacteriales bacterium]
CGEILRIEDFILIARALVELGIDKIRLSGGEPLVRRGVITLAREIGSIEGLKDFAVTTNGILLPQLSKDLWEAGVKRVNISLDTLNEEKYRFITRGGDLKQALDGLDTSLETGFEQVKINVVLMKNFNENEIEEFVKMTLERPIDVRFIELMPFKGQQVFAYGRYLPGSEVLNRCKTLKPIESDDLSAPAKYYRLPGAIGRVGLIEPLSHKFCSRCNRLRITADGKILSCLHSQRELDLRGALHNRDELKSVILQSVMEKPKTHHLSEGQLMERDMGKIGG